ncbi:MAG: hypothetical protein Q9168_002629 [Polycauliona sp. 1 TL-2023]
MDVEHNPNGNKNPRCGSKIAIRNVETGAAIEATVIDTCMGCNFGSIDVNEELFNKVAPLGNGRVHNVEWEVVGSGFGSGSNGGDGGSNNGGGSSSGGNNNNNNNNNNGGGSSSGGGNTAPTPGMQACDTPGATVCSADGSKFGTCNIDHQALMQSVGAGTACRNGGIVAA